MDNYRKIYESWLDSDAFDQDFKVELMSIADDEDEIKDRFYKELAFGTGGMRGVIGAGMNRMNMYTVSRATQGLADYIKSGSDAKIFACEDGADLLKKNSLVIAYDSRRMSKEFASCAAACLSRNGIVTYVFESLRPTPELSYAVRQLGCRAGIVITASHNPPEYNGYKVYWADGGQITDKLAGDITECISRLEYLPYFKNSNDGEASGAAIKYIGSEIDDGYIETLKALILRPDSISEAAESLRIVYTPLHGAGNVPVQRILRELGFKNVWIVPEQEMPDGEFPTVSYPNPEDPAAFDLALKLAGTVDAHLVLATDPDSDRLGIFVKDADGKYVSFTGNMSALLIADYRLAMIREDLGIGAAEYLQNSAIVSTIVSSRMARAIAEEYGTFIIETLTGFKYIGEQIRLFESMARMPAADSDGRGKLLMQESGGGDSGITNHDKSYNLEKGALRFLFGFEESYGCLPGIYTRDKDAVAAVMCLCEAAAYYMTRGMSLADQMRNMYKKYGFYREALLSVTLPGADGSVRIGEYMDLMRKTPPSEFAGTGVVESKDYMEPGHMICNVLTGESVFENPVYMPTSNVLSFDLEDGSWVCVRPSGTEPKIKFYLGVREDCMEDADNKLERLKAVFANVI